MRSTSRRGWRGSRRRAGLDTPVPVRTLSAP
jgi:hypothetical protein